MKKTFSAILVVLLLSISMVFAQEHNFVETKQLIDSGMSCDALTDEQLEAIGDYYMEQMHPGESHELMDEMMGGEGSASLKQVHINMAKRLYCNENVYIGYGMMSSGGMMNMMGGSFMGGSWWLWSIVGMVFWIALIVALILLIIWLYKKVTGQATNGGTTLEILKNRFAKGEISKKEFESMKKELG